MGIDFEGKKQNINFRKITGITFSLAVKNMISFERFKRQI